MQPHAVTARICPLVNKHPDLSPSTAQPCCDSPLDIEPVLSPASPDPSGRGFLRAQLFLQSRIHTRPLIPHNRVHRGIPQRLVGHDHVRPHHPLELRPELLDRFA